MTDAEIDALLARLDSMPGWYDGRSDCVAAAAAIRQLRAERDQFQHAAQSATVRAEGLEDYVERNDFIGGWRIRAEAAEAMLAGARAERDAPQTTAVLTEYSAERDDAARAARQNLAAAGRNYARALAAEAMLADARGALHRISLAEADQSTSAADKVRDMAKQARAALARTAPQTGGA